jgi:predicted RNase H-like HicB family nuclease
VAATYGLEWRWRFIEGTAMPYKVSVVLEKDENGYYAWCPELKGCQSQGESLDEALSNIREAVELYLESMPEKERRTVLSREVLTTALEVHV